MVRVAVLRRVADPEDGSVVERDPPRSLDVEEERIDRIVHPDQLQAAARERTGRDRLPVVVRFEAPAPNPACHPAAPQIVAEPAQVHHDQV